MTIQHVTDPDATMVDLLRRRAADQAARQAYTFLLDGESQVVSLTYGELDDQARAIGAQLQRLEVAGERILLLYPPGLEYIAAFFGCLYAGAVAIPAYPPRLNRPLDRLQVILADARPTLALTSNAILASLEQRFATEPALAALRWLATDDLSVELAEAWQQPSISGAHLAFLQYTSGSTAAPKGVMLSHANLLHNSALIQHAFEHTSASQGVVWLPPYHDMGLIGGILQPLYGGFPVVLMSPVAFLQRPLRWLQAVTRYQATTSGGPNFAYDLCARKIAPEQRETLDLSSWHVAFNGAEPIRPDTIERFVAAFAPCGFRREAFYPCYGLAEATLIVSGGQAAAAPVVRTFQGAALEHNQAIELAVDTHAEDERTLVGCGQALSGQQIVVVDPETLIACPPGRVGEIWLAGPSIAQGYWNQPEETGRAFQASIVGRAGGLFLRTGDLGFVQDGELFITGRLKDLIIIRGRNHYPQDIELTVEQCHQALRLGGGAALAIEVEGEERLVVVQELERQYRNVDAEAVARAIRQAVAEEHELQVCAVVLIKPGSIPKTSSGKIQRYLCRAEFLSGRLEVIGSSILNGSDADWSEPELTRDTLLDAPPDARWPLAELYLCRRVARVLGTAPERIDLQQPLSTLGLDSLMAVGLQHAVEADLGVVVPMVSFLQEISVAQLADEILAHVKDTPDREVELIRAPGTSLEHPLSHGQRALWFLQQLAPESAAYNIASAVRIRGQLAVPALRQTLQRLVDRHPSLRTTFAARQGEPIQQIHSTGTLAFHVEDATSWSPSALQERLTAEAHRPFDLAQGPLLRVYLFTRSAQEHVLLLVVHHIVADLWSLAVLTHELGVLYPAEQAGSAATLAPLPLDYSDYVRWQAALLASTAGERLWTYWRRRLAGPLPILNLPTDRPRPPIQTYRGATHAFTLNGDLARRLKLLALAEGTTLYTTLLAAFMALLHRYSGQDDILVGTATTGRSRAELANLIGYFVNPIPLRADLSGNPTFTALLTQMRQTILTAFEHQEYPFSALVERLQPERDPSRSPLFQVAFVLQKAHLLDDAGLTGFALGESGAQMRLAGLELESIALEQRTAQFDLMLLIAETAGGLAGSLQYNADLFDAATIARMAGHLQTLLDGIAADPEQRLSDLPLLTAAERQRLLVEWNHTHVDGLRAQCIHQLFEAQVARTPEALALVFEEQRLTYQELDCRANQLAHALQALGVGPEVRVAIYMERSPEVIVALLGVLKAGGAYVPLDPAYPHERLAFMLQDSQAAVLISQPCVNDRLAALQSSALVLLDHAVPTIAQYPSTPPASAVTPDNLAYVIYTSGSAGRPKGVAITHRSASARLCWSHQQFTPEQLSGVLAATSLCFDLSVFEIFAPLTCGGAVVLAANALELPRLPAAAMVTLVNTVPSAMAELLRLGGIPATVRTCTLAGEVLPRALVEAVYDQTQIAEVYNLYGPTEDTTYSTAALIGVGEAGPPPIGRPLPHTYAYVLDARLQPVAVGVPGELYLGGAGLARGYLGRPDLTAERFVPNPFADCRLQIADCRLSDPDSTIYNSERLYRTGDLVCYRADGALEYLGRSDQQVKLRGYRIELGEVEAALRQHPAVAAGIVLMREDVPGDRRLVAYIVPSPSSVVSGQLSQSQNDVQNNGQRTTDNRQLTNELRAFLQERLPDYMLPSLFVTLEALPRLPNDKVDRRALPAPDQSALAPIKAYVAPRTALEQELAAIWRAVLRRDRIGIHDNFFGLGGHSLLATQVVAHIRAALRIDLPLRSLFESPTIADLAAAIEALRWAAQGIQAAQQPAADDREQGQL